MNKIQFPHIKSWPCCTFFTYLLVFRLYCDPHSLLIKKLPYFTTYPRIALFIVIRLLGWRILEAIESLFATGLPWGWDENFTWGSPRQCTLGSGLQIKSRNIIRAVLLYAQFCSRWCKPLHSEITYWRSQLECEQNERNSLVRPT